MSYRIALGAAACLALVIGAGLSTGPAYAMGQSVTAVGSFDLFDKASLGVGRLVAFASVAILAYVALTAFWLPIERAVGWLLIPLGQASLYAYAVHLFVIVLAYNVPPYVGSDQPGWELHNSVGQLGLVLLIWAMVKRKVLFGLIPR
jgi:fucose 4-O-acetylase-like acetyltransferase